MKPVKLKQSSKLYLTKRKHKNKLNFSMTLKKESFAITVVQSDLYYSCLDYPRNSIIRCFRGQNLVRPSKADNRGLTIVT